MEWGKGAYISKKKLMSMNDHEQEKFKLELDFF